MSNFTKYPFVEIDGDFEVVEGWKNISVEIHKQLSRVKSKKKIVVVEYYPGVLEEETTLGLKGEINPESIFFTKDCLHAEEKIREMVYPYVTDDRVFGHLTGLDIDSYFDPDKTENARKEIESVRSGVVLVVGTGASYVANDYDLLVYADMARWEIQRRMREHLIDNVGMNNRAIEDWMLLYKQGYFVDWRVCDRLKKTLMKKWDYVLDTNNRDTPKMVSAPLQRG
jgi:hypothetical protein